MKATGITGGVVTRVLGKHADCGGVVIYTSSRSSGSRRCDKCGADGTRGASPETEEDAKARASR